MLIDKNEAIHIVDQISKQSKYQVRFDSLYHHNTYLGAIKFSLDNGLKIVLAHDDRASVFSYQTWFRVGSRDDPPKKTGMAHLLEHLMFKGTKNHVAGEFDRIMEDRGSQTNAATFLDWTYYTTSLAMYKDNLEKLIYFESDRMSNLVFCEETFKSELDVVKNERRMNVDDCVEGKMAEELYSLAYQDHSYKSPIIGYMKDLQSITLKDVENFYHTYYHPNNAVIVVVGNIDIYTTLKLIYESYGHLLKKSVTRLKQKQESIQSSLRRKDLSLSVNTSYICIAYHAPDPLTKEFIALEILVDAIFLGESSRLYRRLVIEENIVNHIEANITSTLDAGLLEIYISLYPFVSSQKVINIVHEELKKSCLGLTQKEYNKACNQLKIASLEIFQDIENYAEMCGYYECNFDDFSLVFQLMNRFDQIDFDMIKKVAKTIFSKDNEVIVTALV